MIFLPFMNNLINYVLELTELKYIIRTQDIKLFITTCSLCQLGPFSLAQGGEHRYIAVYSSVTVYITQKEELTCKLMLNNCSVLENNVLPEYAVPCCAVLWNNDNQNRMGQRNKY